MALTQGQYPGPLRANGSRRRRAGGGDRYAPATPSSSTRTEISG
jgi:hypothetical protein